eukprot:scaffold19623_cov46-Attheya_sp.AAC.2
MCGMGPVSAPLTIEGTVSTVSADGGVDMRSAFGRRLKVGVGWGLRSLHFRGPLSFRRGALGTVLNLGCTGVKAKNSHLRPKLQYYSISYYGDAMVMILTFLGFLQYVDDF